MMTHDDWQERFVDAGNHAKPGLRICQHQIRGLRVGRQSKWRVTTIQQEHARHETTLCMLARPPAQGPHPYTS